MAPHHLRPATDRRLPLLHQMPLRRQSMAASIPSRIYHSRYSLAVWIARVFIIPTDVEYHNIAVDTPRGTADIYRGHPGINRRWESTAETFACASALHTKYITEEPSPANVPILPSVLLTTSYFLLQLRNNYGPTCYKNQRHSDIVHGCVSCKATKK